MLGPPLTLSEREDGGKEEGGALAYTQERSVRRQSSRPAKESSNTLGLPWVFEEVVSP